MIRFLKAAKNQNSRNKVKAWPSNAVQYLPQFLWGFVKFMLGWLAPAGLEVAKIVDKVRAECKDADKNVKYAHELEPTAYEKTVMDQINGKLTPEKVWTFGTLNDGAFYQIIANKAGKEMHIVPTIGKERENGASLFIKELDNGQMAPMYQIKEYDDDPQVVYIKDLSTDFYWYNEDKEGYQISQREDCGMFDYCDRERFEVVVHPQYAWFKFKNLQTKKFLTWSENNVDTYPLWADGSEASAGWFQILKVGSKPNYSQQSVVDRYVSKSKRWLEKQKPFLECAQDVISPLYPGNPITQAILQIAAVTAARVVGHILLAVFTLGIGNAVLSAITNTILIINGTLAMIKTAIALGKGIYQVFNDQPAEGFEAIGEQLPNLVLAVMKFFGAARRRQKKQRFAVYNRVHRKIVLRNRLSKKMRKLK